MGKITVHKAKKIIKAELDRRGLNYKLTARTISFVDLARASCVFVRIHGWKPNPMWSEIKKVAIENGFRIES